MRQFQPGPDIEATRTRSARKVVYQVLDGGRTSLGCNWMANLARDLNKGDSQEVNYLNRGSIAGSVLGALVFLGGIGLLALTFDLCWQMFHTPPATLFNTQGKPLDVNQAAMTLMNVIVRILLLLVMAIVGGVVANRGIHMYADSRSSSKAVIIKEKSSEPERRHERIG